MAGQALANRCWKLSAASRVILLLVVIAHENIQIYPTSQDPIFVTQSRDFRADEKHCLWRRPGDNRPSQARSNVGLDHITYNDLDQLIFMVTSPPAGSQLAEGTARAQSSTHNPQDCKAYMQLFFLFVLLSFSHVGACLESSEKGSFTGLIFMLIICFILF